MFRTGTLAATAAMIFAGIALAGGGPIVWMDDYDQALAKARMTGKPLMVKFFATW